MTCDWIPLVSQLKSLVQLLFARDRRAAAQTQYNFVTQCPVLAHCLGFLFIPVYAPLGREAIKGGSRTVSSSMDRFLDNKLLTT